MRVPSPCRIRRAGLILPGPILLAALAITAQGQTEPSTLIAQKDLVLAAKTPLGEAHIVILSGTTITNYEMQGAQVRVWQGPFTATLAVADVQPAANPPPETSSTAEPPSPPSSAPEPAPSTEDTPPAETAPIADAAPTPPTTDKADISLALPIWLLPSVLGALVGYALSATLALFRGERRGPGQHAPPTRMMETPVVTIPTKPGAKPAVVSDGGRAIACPLCAENIPIEKISRGRNRCPFCQGSFVGE